MPHTEPTAIHWHRRDLRIQDNPGLSHASARGLCVVPVYVQSTWKSDHAWTGPIRQQFLCGCIESLARNLESIGGRLIIRRGDAAAELRKLIIEIGAVALHFHRDPDPFGREAERRVEVMCRELGVECVAHDDVALHQPGEVLTQGGLPYKVYTPYSRNWLNLEKSAPIGTPANLRTPADVASRPLPSLADWGLKVPSATTVVPGERAARQRLKHAINGIIQAYGQTRDVPSADGTSRLSQDLRFGLLSIRTVYAAAIKARAAANAAGRAGIDIFIKELAWREFYFAILYHFPNVLNEEFNPDWRGLPWVVPGENFERWKQGLTGFPIVDAGMRQLRETGFMHNRLRMITAMFLTKDLHHDWKLGESWFMRQLVDGEIASNNGGWQWSAGTGADAAPYFRIQNPWSQSARHDPEGIYIRRWVPELAHIRDPKILHSPPESRIPIAPDYPLPCVDHKIERDRTLAIFKQHRARAPR
jgi:deoxyribodipyrimidine photo-lyase